MLAVTQAFHDARLISAARATVLFILTTAWGSYVWSDDEPDDAALEYLGKALADGTYLADGTAPTPDRTFTILGHGGLVKSYGSISESLEPTQGEVVKGLSQDEAGELSVELYNRDNLLAEIEARQNLLFAIGEIRLGWAGLFGGDYLTRYQGTVTDYKLSRDACSLTMRAV